MARTIPHPAALPGTDALRAELAGLRKRVTELERDRVNMWALAFGPLPPPEPQLPSGPPRLADVIPLRPRGAA